MGLCICTCFTADIYVYRRARSRFCGGVEQESSFMETNVLRGEFLNDERTRDEFMSIVNRRGTRE